MRVQGIRQLVAGRSRSIANLTALSVASAAIFVAAATSDGYKATNVDLDDGAVWVTDESRNQIGRLVVAIDQVDVVRTIGTHPDVLQDGRQVIAGDDTGTRWIQVETAKDATRPSPAPLAAIRSGGGVMVVHDAESGKLWTGPSTGLLAPEFPRGAVGRVAAGSIVEVTASGRLIVIDPAGPVWFEIDLDPSGRLVLPVDDTATTVASENEAAPTTTVTVEGAEEEVTVLEPENRISIPRSIPDGVVSTVVGEQVVLLTPQGEVFALDGRTVSIPGSGWRLQQRSKAGGDVLVATDEALYEVDLDGEARVVAQGQPGAAAAPVVVASCIYGAWASSSDAAPSYVYACGDDEVTSSPVEGAIPGAPLEYRVNGLNLALNSLKDGPVWAVHDGELVDIGEWGEELGADSEDDSPDPTGSVDERADQRCDVGGENLPPEVEPDELGARTGVQTMLDVLANDSDADCDPISIAGELEYDEAYGSFTVVDNGQRILFSPKPELVLPASVSVTVGYHAVDVTGASSASTASATIEISPPPPVDGATGNRPPAIGTAGAERARPQLVTVEQGERISFDALADWFDPDGDEITLEGVTLPPDAGEVSFSPLGRVQLSVPNVRPGQYELEVTVFDGRARSTGIIEAEVQAEGTELDPKATNDFVTAAVGETVVVRPMANDGDPNGPEDLSSIIVADPDQYRVRGLAVRANPNGELEIKVLTPEEGGVAVDGAIGIPYTLTDQTQRSSQATVQVNVVVGSAENSLPVAVPDRTVIRPGRVVNVDVLDNDVDPDGDLLAIVDIDTPDPTAERGGVRVAVVDRRFLQVELVRPLDGSLLSGTFPVSYWASDGSFEDPVRGQLVVIADASTNDQPPVGNPDVVTVRAGQVARVDVLTNDLDPDGDQVTLIGVNESQLADRVAEGAFFAWVDDGAVWVRGGTPGNSDLLYDIEANDRPGNGQVKIRVVGPAGADTPNLPPEPVDLEVRVARGSTVRIPVPLDGIDPDGDRIELESVLATSHPQESRAARSETEAGVIEYSVQSGSSVVHDSFEYEIRDTGTGGTRVVAEVRVVVVDVDRSPPVAHDDVLRARPGSEVVVPVLANDVDADDDEIRLAEPPFVDALGVPTEDPLSGDAVEADADAENPVLRGGFIQVKVPAEGSITERYRITDETFTAFATVQVIADPAAPNLAPVTQGRTIESSEVEGQPVGAVFEVNVALPSYDPDGSSNDLVYGVPAGQPGVTAEAAGGSVLVTLLAADQTVVYSVTDADSEQPATAFGVLYVPGVETNSPPEAIDPDRVWELRVENGWTLPFTLDGLVTDPDAGDIVVLTGADVSAASPLKAERTADNRGFSISLDGEVSAQSEIVVTYEVEDRPDEPLSLPRTFPLRIRIIPEDANSAPRRLTDGTINVPLEDEPQQLDLTNLIEDDEGDKIAFQITGQPANVDVGLNDIGLLVVTGRDENAPLGPAGSITFTFTDNQKDHQPLSAAVQVVITPTNRAAPTAAPLGPFEALTGRPASAVDVIRAASNPGGYPLVITSVSVVGRGTVGCSAACGAGPIVFTPLEPGTFTVQYTLSETITGARTTTSTITFVAKGEPLAPGTPSIVSVGDERVSLSWTPADMQGGTLANYIVRVVGTNQTQSTTSTSHEFTGLQNNTTYQFEVLAVNEVGEGAPSRPSSGARPDRVPDEPLNPRFTSYENAALNLAWDPPATASSSRYSPIIEYQVQLNGFGTFTVGAGSTALRQASLTNGTDYTFRVRARNGADTDGGWGAWSTVSQPERPSTSPSQVTGVVVTPSGDGGQARATVTWSAPSDGGRPILNYIVCSVPATLGCPTAPLTRRQEFVVPSGSQFAFTVQAVNSDINTPNGPVSAQSTIFRGVMLPGAPTNLVVTNPSSGTLSATAAAGSNGGCTSVSVEYSINGTAWQASGSFSGQPNGMQRTISARTRLAAACEQYLTAATRATPWSPTVTAVGTPYGPLVRPSVSSSASGTTITFNWNAAQGSNGRTWTGQVLGGVCDQAIGAGNAAGSCTVTVGYSASRTLTVRVTDTGTGTGEVLDASRTESTGPQPPAAISTSNSGRIDPGCRYANCTNVNVSGVNFTPNSSLQVFCEGDPRWFSLGTTDGNGNFGTIRAVCYHTPGAGGQLITVRDGSGRSASQVSQW